MDFATFRKKVASRRRTAGLSSSIDILERIHHPVTGEPCGLRLVVNIFTKPSYWLEMANGCKDFAIFTIDPNISNWSTDSLQSQNMSILITPRSPLD